ncbi:hypothetical protein [Avibacterium paragallinarum]|uniref:Uncharacterized protein n=1 Tax=Avibacterium paragallinarum TaxID=728 RepID=A0A377I6W4_AVIPA|nr:hypothetical protein [Avibacterium paragallinarum]RZN55591.1 hypothetical protein EIG78_10580 [Avibacterium paragallinarum]RZN60801.1 hypothetical protein EIG79_02620 [Avibacterium paragallinarum]RZN78227.1 hypothetical protein EC523_00985 [Avibacterium paragallinarum]TID19266.1 hypothetical protein JO83_08760 [Avibacterium paragallinarum]CDF98915.1 Hypothetical protein AJF4211_000100 [Avibacterium paragallinarum JF4211]
MNIFEEELKEAELKLKALKLVPEFQGLMMVDAQFVLKQIELILLNFQTVKSDQAKFDEVALKLQAEIQRCQLRLTE